MGFTAKGEGARESPFRRADGDGPAFVALWATGADTTIDGILRVQARVRDGSGTWSELDVLARPFRHGELDSNARRMARELALDPSELANALDASRAVERLVAFVGERQLVAADGEATRNWLRHFGFATTAERVLGLPEIASVVAPAGMREVARTSIDSRAVEATLASIVRDLHAVGSEALELLAAAWTHAWRGLNESDLPAAARLASVLRIAQRPSRWTDDACDWEVADQEASAEHVIDLVDGITPRCATVGKQWREFDTVPVGDDELLPFDESQLGLVDDVFRVHLPALLSNANGSYRRGQHDVARRIAETLGSGKLLLVHAPTGTGKTLAHLVPAFLWSVRHGVRIGVSTYTRALQEQALDQDVPLALRALERAGVSSLPRVTLLEGRANYLCWRALKLHVPAEDDNGDTWLAWASLVAFALMDDDGNLDRCPMNVALSNAPASYLREIESLARAVQATMGCCKVRADRDACAAEVARLRAERSHVVITNHAFALARQSFFRHVIFDECEHLHDQAGSAWSHTITSRAIREQLGRLRQPGRPMSRAPLDRLERALFEGLAGSEPLQASIKAWYAALGALETLDATLDAHRDWRHEQSRARDPRDEHSLLREYVELDEARPMIDARVQLARAANELDLALSQLAAGLETFQLQGAARARRQLELARFEIAEWLAAVDAWLPMQDGQVRLRPDTFHDVEENARGETLLAARVLLPNEFLGRHYYPQLRSAVFISATTWLRGGFESALGYLGLDRAAQPAEDEAREPREVTTFRADDPFDYGRVAVFVPSDAPTISASREAFSAYVRDFIARLGERTRGRMLVLFTNSDEARRTGHELAGFFRARGIPLWFQNMPGRRKEELGTLFRARIDSILLGVDTFWYGADFPGETLEYLVIVKLPYGVPDRYHFAQCAALGQREQRRRVYMPRAFAKFRQGFGRLMRRESDRGCVFVLDARVLTGANKLFLGELPLASELGRASDAEWTRGGARLVVDTTDRCIDAALEHMRSFDENGSAGPIVIREPAPRTLEIAPDDVPF